MFEPAPTSRARSSPPSENSSPIVVAIGGFDPTGGAGVVRDLLTARTFGAAIRLIPTAWTEQSPAGVRQIEPRNPRALCAAIVEALSAARRHCELAQASQPSQFTQRSTGGSAPGPMPVVKIGMLPDEAAVDAVAHALNGFTGAVVLDPVLAATSGGALFSGRPASLTALAGRVTLITPNASEAAVLTGASVRNGEEARAAASLLRSLGFANVLVKGGHLEPGADAVDILLASHADGAREFRTPWVMGPSVRGTGCALATAIAVGLARGHTLEAAIASAKEWLQTALIQAVPVSDEWHLS